MNNHCLMMLHCDDNPSKAGLRLITQGLDYWDGRRSDDTSPQLSASSSPTDSESFDNTTNHDVFDPPEKENFEAVGCGDPSWVARPRNAFIIFRCEYARRHARMGSGVKRGTGPASEKSLSKRAAEAWHQLSSKEKSHFKALADHERSEHARLHPDYRFRPVKRILPTRGSRPRAKSLSNDLSQFSSDLPMVEPKRVSSQRSAGHLSSNVLPSAPDKEEPTPISPTYTTDSCDTSQPFACEPVYPSGFLSPQQCENTSWPIQSTTSPMNYHYHEAMQAQSLLYSADFDPCNLVNLHQEGTLPHLPQSAAITTDLCSLEHPIPLSAAPSALLADWSDNSIDDSSPSPIAENPLSPTCETLSWCSEYEDLFEGAPPGSEVQPNCATDKDASLLFAQSYSPTHSYVTHSEYLCCRNGYSTIVTCHSFSPYPLPTVDDTVIGVDTYLYLC